MRVQYTPVLTVHYSDTIKFSVVDIRPEQFHFSQPGSRTRQRRGDWIDDRNADIQKCARPVIRAFTLFSSSGLYFLATIPGKPPPMRAIIFWNLPIFFIICCICPNLFSIVFNSVTLTPLPLAMRTRRLALRMAGF